jgi:hypothetical protein
MRSQFHQLSLCFALVVSAVLGMEPKAIPSSLVLVLSVPELMSHESPWTFFVIFKINISKVLSNSLESVDNALQLRGIY